MAETDLVVNEVQIVLVLFGKLVQLEPEIVVVAWLAVEQQIVDQKRSLVVVDEIGWPRVDSS